MRPLPGPNEERVYYMGGTWAPVITIILKGVPPCLWCGHAVTDPSMDGPLVCSSCDCGVSRVTRQKWSADEYAELSRHFKESVEVYRSLSEARDRELVVSGSLGR